MWLAGLRDAAIVFLTLESIVIGVLLAITILQIRALVRLLREEIQPMLDAANDTMATVQGTTHLVSETVETVAKATTYVTGSVQVVKSLFLIGRQLRRRRRGAGAGAARSSEVHGSSPDLAEGSDA